MTRAELTARIVEAKRDRGLSWGAIADAVGRDRVWTTAACLGEHPFDPDAAATLVELLELGDEEARALLCDVPSRGPGVNGPPPTDPTIYRLYEVLSVYGPTLKELINEDFGDGIMSAINFRLSVDREERDGEARVKITLDGKYLPYQW